MVGQSLHQDKRKLVFLIFFFLYFSLPIRPFVKQRNLKSPDLRHKTTQEPLWLCGWCNSSWVLQELSRRGMLLSPTDIKHRKLDLGKEENLEDLHTESLSFVSSLKVCAEKKDLDQGLKIHADIRAHGLLEKDIHLGNLVALMYAKCGAVAQAQQVLKELPIQEEVAWNAIIVNFVQQGQGAKAFDCYERMRSDGLSLNAISYASVLKACGITREVKKGKQIHDEIISKGLLGKDVVLGTALIDMYVKCGALAKAELVLDQMSVHDVVSWNALIAGYAQQGYGKKALECFRQMRIKGFTPDAITYTCILKACGNTREIERGKQVHEEIASLGLLETDVVLGNALVNMYTKCGEIAKAQEVFDNLNVRDTASWHSLITGYAQQGQCEKVLDCYDQMRNGGLSPHPITYPCILKACSISQEVDKGKKIHDEIISRRLLGKDVVLGNALVDMYVKCGAIVKARQVLDDLPLRNVISWNALITGYAQQGQDEEALNCLQRMQIEGLTPNIVSWSALIAGYVQQGKGQEAVDCYEKLQSNGLAPNAVTYASILKACGITQRIDKGKQIHDEIICGGLLAGDVIIGAALIDMYSKCGAITKAQKVFDKLPYRDVFCWSTLIAGYAQQGKVGKALDRFQQMQSEGLTPNIACWNALLGGYAQQGLVEEVLDYFELMQHQGLSPDAITFVCVLNACSHSGSINEGQYFFENMKEKYGVIPGIQHDVCMVDLFGRAGHFEKALTVIKKMPSSDHPPIWSALLGACRKWGEVQLGRLAFERAIQINNQEAAAYVLMTNIYTAAGMHEDARKIEAMRMRNAAWKKPGRSWWIDVNGDVHTFDVGDTKHAQWTLIKAKLQDLALKMSQEGYLPSLSQNISNELKKDLLCGHSEKLAIACGLINTPQGEDIQIMKNMRVCGDCHVVTSLISKIEKRKITVKDANRVHVFESGKCSCGDYW